jgi:hypothetical protein
VQTLQCHPHTQQKHSCTTHCVTPNSSCTLNCSYDSMHTWSFSTITSTAAMPVLLLPALDHSLQQQTQRYTCICDTRAAAASSIHELLCCYPWSWCSRWVRLTASRTPEPSAGVLLSLPLVDWVVGRLLAAPQPSAVVLLSPALVHCVVAVHCLLHPIRQLIQFCC